MKYSISKALKQIETKGWYLCKGIYKKKLILDIKDEFENSIKKFEKIQKKKKIFNKTKNSYHHVPLVCRKMLKLLNKNYAFDILEKYFNGKFILSTMGIARVSKNQGVYTQKIHRDVRSFTGDSKLWINTLIMLDDSTKENGSTWILEGSQKKNKKPNKNYFFANAKQIVGKAGDMLIFDGNVWHASGENRTKKSRNVITPIFSKPFIKQQLDYPRAFGYDFKNTLDQFTAQILGYNALVPTMLEEFYQKEEDRFYKSDQG